MTVDVAEGPARLVTALEADGVLRDRLWRNAFADVARHVFVPRFFMATADRRWRAVTADHPAYRPLVYSDTALTVQLDGTTDPNPTAGRVSGASSCVSPEPGLTAAMLESLQVSAGQRVLEVGTGTGFTAGLLSHRLGADNVTTIDIDPALADGARARLADAGYRPRVVVGDGMLGCSVAAPFDRLLATCSVPAVPHAWVDQVRNGGMIIASLWRELGGGPLVRLAVNSGTAQGFFLPHTATLPPATSARRMSPALTAAALGKAVEQTGSGVTRRMRLDTSVLGYPDTGLWVALLVRGVTQVRYTPDDGREHLFLLAVDGSWAGTEVGSGRVEQHGNRALWDEVEAAHDRWREAGAPTRGRLGLTVTEAGVHRFWVDSPDRLLWADRPGPSV